MHYDVLSEVIGQGTGFIPQKTLRAWRKSLDGNVCPETTRKEKEIIESIQKIDFSTLNPFQRMKMWREIEPFLTDY